MGFLKNLSVLLFVMAFWACGEVAPTEQAVLTDSIVVNEFDDRAIREQSMKDRIARGDTLILDPDQLSLLLPQSFSGFKLDDTSSHFIEFDQRRMSEALSNWSKEEVDVQLSLIDYNRNLQTWNGLCELYRSTYVQDSEEELSLAWAAGLGENFSWLSHLKGEQHYRISMGFGYRYLLTIECSGISDTAQLRTLIGNADWSQLQQTK
jgi:hypothetical protein